jgi:hypothetical protein
VSDALAIGALECSIPSGRTDSAPSVPQLAVHIRFLILHRHHEVVTEFHRGSPRKKLRSRIPRRKLRSRSLQAMFTGLAAHRRMMALALTVARQLQLQSIVSEPAFDNSFNLHRRGNPVEQCRLEVLGGGRGGG